jgi:hypothetical protein
VCLNVYISSSRELPQIQWDEKTPSFYLLKEEDNKTLGMLAPILGDKLIYQAFSFMGCSCGLSYGEWSMSNLEENHEQRQKDVQSFIQYLNFHKENNTLEVFCTWWYDFPDHYYSKPFILSDQIGKMEFDLEEMVILKVI